MKTLNKPVSITLIVLVLAFGLSFVATTILLSLKKKASVNSNWQPVLSPCLNKEKEVVTCGTGTQSIDFECLDSKGCLTQKPKSILQKCIINSSCKWKQE